ncbi:MAG: RrF2 family transcriptional regulator [Verrucomicrobiales bacterium]|nr:Rrf2 family transcriptional regulator [Verrucomicrobiota bacterium JB025]
MKLLSDASEYALRGVVWLAQRNGRTFKLREIADGTKAAPGYLIKVLQSLTKAGILSTQRGSTGGFSLIRDPATLTALEVINAVDPIERIHTCPLGLKSHGTCLCPMHKQIDEAMATIEGAFENSTIADLLDSNASSIPMSNGPLNHSPES